MTSAAERGTGPGCRCQPCRDAASAYERERTRRVTPPYVSAGPVREHLAWLSDQGVGLKAVARLSGVATGTLSKIVYGVYGKRPPTKRVRPETRDRILAVRPAEGLDGSTQPAAPIWKIIDQLLDRGWTRAAIARAIGQRGPGLQLGRDTITRGNARAVAALLDQPVPPRRSRHGLHPQPQDHLQIDPVAEATELDRIERTLDRYELPILPTRDAAWMRSAACRLPDVPTWLFFPGHGDTETMDRARAVCATCPVQADCLEAAMATGEHGVWAGTSRKQREEIAGSRTGRRPLEAAS